VRVAIIPARGGSKRIPRKNVRHFAGKPMIAHSIQTAISSGLFERVLVSTDDEEIAHVARSFGAEVPFVRPVHLADDRTGTSEVVAHAIGWLVEHGVKPSAVCCIYATAPFMLQEDLQRALTLLETADWQFVFAATSYAAPIFRSFRRLPGGGLEMFFPEHFNTRSQDLPQALHDAAQFYWGRPQAWLAGLRVFDRHSSVIEIPSWRVQDIDTEEDWARAERLAISISSGAQLPDGI
jgi:N-acylneuraminate cytidylyltransferase